MQILYTLLRQGDCDTFQQEVTRFLNLNSTPEGEYETLLQLAVRLGLLPAIITMALHGVDFNYASAREGHNHRTPLQQALFFKTRSAVRLLILLGANSVTLSDDEREQ